MDESLTFDEKFSALGEYYEIESPDDISRQIKKNENIFILLDEIKPYLEESFGDAKYSLNMNFEPEVDDEFIILFINVPQERYNNGILDDITQFEFDIHELRHRISVFREVIVMPEVLNV